MSVLIGSMVNEVNHLQINASEGHVGWFLEYHEGFVLCIRMSERSVAVGRIYADNALLRQAHKLGLLTIVGYADRSCIYRRGL